MHEHQQTSYLKQILRYQELTVFIALVLLWILGSLLRPDFFPSQRNFFSIFQEMSQLGIIAVGMTFVIINGDIDLSVGSVMGLATANFAVMTNFYHWNAWLVALIVLLIGVVIGFVNGILATKGKLPAFIATLGMLFLARGLALAISGGYQIAPLPPSSFYIVGLHNQTLGRLNNQVFVLIAVAVIGSIVLRKTIFGYRVYSTGGNLQAAKFSGINTDRVRIYGFIISSFCASLAGLLNIAFMKNFSPSTGLSFELNVIAAVVVGGTSIFGGRGSVLGTIIGAGILVTIRKILTIGIYLGDSRPWRLLQTANPIFIGIAILLAVLFDIWVREEEILKRWWAKLQGKHVPARPTQIAASETLGTGGYVVTLAPPKTAVGKIAERLLEYRESGGIILLLILIAVGYSFRPDYFFSLNNFFNVLRDQIVEIGLITVGMTMVIINKDIDLSVGSVMSLGAALWSILVKGHEWNGWVAAGFTILVGLLIGTLNGLLATKGRLPAFIATLGMLHFARGLSATLAGGWQLTQFPKTSFFLIGSDNRALFGLPNQVFIFLIVVLVGGLVLWRGNYGYQVYSTGGNARAALLAGIPTDWVRLRAFMLCSTLAAISGMISVTKIKSFAPQLGLGQELNVIAAVIVGGTSLFGGRGTIAGSIIGAFVLGYLNSIISTGILVDGQIRSIPQRWLQIVIGSVILGAVLFDIWVRNEKIIQRTWSKLRHG
ncbi:hypothetical protein GF339_18305 [candidate division KSB3 bacterium]|uniref:ABC transporter permease n=1 Tax=candidate division KSB3 bacterium TaxID=2044937 RepID=A0A9D5JYH1_9BACT|nr:hypothetical protein [candidate division KSB3 bacterium]MBD3326543.1 hypothetical protein [candidate division KSB3 bacterium]